MEITGRTRVVGLLGHPISKSPFPALVNAAFEALEEPYAMVPFDVDPARLREALSAGRAFGFAGFGLSRPHKEAACDLMDSLGATSQLVCSTDTVSVEGHRFVGHNTDLWSFLAALKEDGGVSLAGKRALLVGAGGTARAIAAALLQEGISSLRISNRSPERAQGLADDFSKKFPKARLGAVPYRSNDFRNALKDADLLVNATPSDLETPQGPLLLEKDLHPALVVFDAIYTHVTPLLLSARTAGCKALSGTRMLLWQTVYSVKQWIGREPPREPLERALNGVLAPTAAAV